MPDPAFQAAADGRRTTLTWSFFWVTQQPSERTMVPTADDGTFFLLLSLASRLKTSRTLSSGICAGGRTAGEEGEWEGRREEDEEGGRAVGAVRSAASRGEGGGARCLGRQAHIRQQSRCKRSADGSCAAWAQAPPAPVRRPAAQHNKNGVIWTGALLSGVGAPHAAPRQQAEPHLCGAQHAPASLHAPIAAARRTNRHGASEKSREI